MSISLVIPIYNTEAYIRECLVSVLNQTLLPEEIILVNDGTPDNSLGVISDLIEAHPEIIVINQENAGLAAARNTGLTHASKEYVAFLDSDDRLAPNFLENLFTRASAQNLDVLCAGNTRTFPDGSEEVMRRDVALLNEKILTGSEALLIQLQVNNYNMEVVDDLYRTAFLKENQLEFAVGLLHEDEEFTPRVLLKAKRVGFIAEYGYLYRQRAHSIMSSGISERTIVALEKIYLDNLVRFERETQPEAKAALSWLLLHLGESYIDRLNLSKSKKRPEMYARLNLSKLKKAIAFSAQMNRKQSLKFSALNVHYRVFEAMADLQRKLKS